MQPKLIPVLALLAAALVLAAAGRGSSRHAAPVAAPAFKVGLSTDTGGLNDRGFNHLAYLGLQQAESKLGVHGRVVQAASPAEYIPNLARLAQQGYSLVIGVGFTEIQALEAVAKQFPKTHFAIVDVSNADEGGLPNVEGLLFKE